MEIQNKIREGNFETFYTALVEASKKASLSNFILNDLIEVFVYFTFLLDNVNEIFIFSKDFEYLSDVYQKPKRVAQRIQSERQNWMIFGNLSINLSKRKMVSYNSCIRMTKMKRLWKNQKN